MFYSHQLLARKQPLGQIWMAATMHGKFSRRKLSKLNIIKICEEILNPQVPMALRLSGILMEGVVIIYEKKVKLLQDDASRLLVEINQAWKVVPTRDPTLLSKGRTQAKYKDITLPEIQGIDIEDIEQSTGNIKIVEDYPQTMAAGYFTVNLDDVDIGQYINKDPMDVDPSQFHHQADPEDITIFEPVAPPQADNNMFDRFERFDIEGDEDTHMNFSSQDPTNFTSTLIPSPPRQQQPANSDEVLDQHPKDQTDQTVEEENKPKKHQPKHMPVQRKQGKRAAVLIDEQTSIPAPVYHSWLQDTSDIVSPRGGRKKQMTGFLLSTKIAKLMELPPTALSCGLIDTGNNQIHYPKPLLDLWNKTTPPSPPGKIPPPQLQQHSSTNNGFYNDPTGFAFEDFNSGIGSGSFTIPVEVPRAANVNGESTGFSRDLAKDSTPLNAGVVENSYHSSGSGPHSDPIPEDSGRGSKKRTRSSARLDAATLEPVIETSWENRGISNVKLAKIDEIQLTLDQELFVETEPTQVSYPILTPPIDYFTDAIKTNLKAHFDTAGDNQTESLNDLACGMNKTKAAVLFYQTCVLATRAFIKVEQRLPYGNILISRGAKM